MWQKNGKGLKFKASYVYDPTSPNDRSMVLVAIDAKGVVVTKKAESWQMLKAAGWVRSK